MYFVPCFFPPGKFLVFFHEAVRGLGLPSLLEVSSLWETLAQDLGQFFAGGHLRPPAF